MTPFSLSPGSRQRDGGVTAAASMPPSSRRRTSTPAQRSFAGRTGLSKRRRSCCSAPASIRSGCARSGSDQRGERQRPKESDQMTDAFVLGGVRTPVGRYGGSLSHLRTDDLLGQTMAAACEKVDVPLERIEDIT